MNQNGIKNINLYRDFGSIQFEFEDGDILLLYAMNSQFYTKYPTEEGAELVNMSKKDVHNLIRQILAFHRKDKKELKDRLQNMDRWEDFKPGDMK